MSHKRIGQRVIITEDCRAGKNAKGKKGKIIDHVEVDVSGFQTTSPKIELDDGDIIHGFECWWLPYKEPVQAMYT